MVLYFLTTNSEVVKKCCWTFLWRAVNFVSVCSFFFICSPKTMTFSLLPRVFQMDIEEIRLRSRDLVAKNVCGPICYYMKIHRLNTIQTTIIIRIYKKNKFTFSENKNAFTYFVFSQFENWFFLNNL